MIGDLEGAPTPIEVKVFGDDPDTLADISERTREAARGGSSGVVDVVGVQRGNPETTWEIDQVGAGRLGLTVAQVSAQLSDAWLGDVRTELRLADRTIPVRVRYPDAYRLDPVQMAATPVRVARRPVACRSARSRRASTSEGRDHSAAREPADRWRS